MCETGLRNASKIKGQSQCMWIFISKILVSPASLVPSRKGCNLQVNFRLFAPIKCDETGEEDKCGNISVLKPTQEDVPNKFLTCDLN